MVVAICFKDLSLIELGNADPGEAHALKRSSSTSLAHRCEKPVEILEFFAS